MNEWKLQYRKENGNMKINELEYTYLLTYSRNYPSSNVLCLLVLVSKFMFSKKTTRIDEIFTVDLTLCSKRQIDSKDFVNFRGLLRKHKLYQEKGKKLYNSGSAQ